MKENRQRQETRKPVRINLKKYWASKTKCGTTKNHKKPTEMKQRKSFGFSPQLLIEHDSSAFDTLLRTKKCLLIHVITSCDAQNKFHPMVSNFNPQKNPQYCSITTIRTQASNVLKFLG